VNVAFERGEICMRPFRISIAAMMGLVVAAAIGAAIMRQGLAASAAAVFLCTQAILCLAVVGLVCRDRTERARWLAVNLFGWGYLRLRGALWLDLPATVILKSAGSTIGLPSREFDFSFSTEPWLAALELGDCLSALLAALLGGLLARALFDAGKLRNGEAGSDPSPAAPISPPGWYVRPAIVFGTGFAVGITSAIGGSRLASGFWAGATCMLTWGLIGVACTGGLLRRGKARPIYLGAGVFGLAFLVAVFTRSADINVGPRSWELPVPEFLDSIRLAVSPVLSGGQADSARVAAANARIYRALERKVPAHFTDAPLGDFLNFVKEQSRGADGAGIPVYFDPWGMGEYEKNLESRVSIDLEDAPLTVSLHAAMSQLELPYSVRDGLLMIAVPREEELTVYTDPYLVVGSCLLALIAMALGGVLGSVVCAYPRLVVA
jgi:hypothetical protein